MKRRFWKVLPVAVVLGVAMALASCGNNNGEEIPPPLPVITITTQPAPVTNVYLEEITGELTVVANVTQGAELSFQWFSSTENSNAEGTAIDDATSASFSIPTDLTEGEYFFFVEVSATGGAASVRSDVATVNVSIAPFIIDMVRIYADTFYLGGNAPEDMAGGPMHEVTLTQDFYMGIHEVTQAQFYEIMGINPSRFPEGAEVEDTGNFPVDSVTWYHAIVFSNRLSIRNGLIPAYEMQTELGGPWIRDPDLWGEIPTGSDMFWDAVRIVPDSTGYRLPTNAQWEFACRAGANPRTAWNIGDSITQEQANFFILFGEGNLGRTVEVGSYAPNAWGLYDMHGNVKEWVWDWFLPVYPEEPQVDPSNDIPIGAGRVVRGGSWSQNANAARSATRFFATPQSAVTMGIPGQLGFRVIRPATD